MRTSHNLPLPLILFTGLSVALLALAPTSALAQERSEKRTAKTSAPAPKSGHTPATTITNSNGNTILQTSEGGSLLAPNHGGAIPAEGAGARMMWYPAKAAFRAGEVGTSKDGTQWDTDSTGVWSVAFGDDTKASGDWSMAIGNETVASGEEAVAMGQETTASNTEAVAMGFQTTASGFGAVAMNNNTVANANDAVAMGENTTASAKRSVAMGLDTEAGASNSVAMGTLSEATGNGAVAMGFGTSATANHSLVAGRCQVSTGRLFAIGNGTVNSSGDACASFSDALTLSESGDLLIAGSLTENSDRRLKTDIEPLGAETLNALQEIDPVRFRFKNEKTHPSGEQIGLIAQEVQKEFPELVSEGANGMLSLSYTKFSAVLLKGLQEQQSTIEKQQAQISDLKAENEEIKERLAALEAEQTAPVAASLFGSWGLALVLGLGGLAGGLFWRRRS